MDKPRPPRLALIVHAGAWDIPPAERPGHEEGCLEAAERGWAALTSGASALDAVCVAVRSMESDRRLNAGAGSVLCREGHVECDAGLMSGTTLESGGVAALRDVEHPIDAARAVLDSPYVLLVGSGASAFLREHGVPACDPGGLVEPRERERLQAFLRREGANRAGAEFGMPGDTVGAVAVDRMGRIAAAASTGGMVGKPPGRMGDTAIPGAGYYADDLAAGAAATGWGEKILRAGLSRRAVDLAREHNALDAAWLAMREFESRFEGRGGLILAARDGSIAFSFNTPHMPHAYRDESLSGPVFGGLGSSARPSQ
jgi:beta-aspartyl-peptidase (threonine type)